MKKYKFEELEIGVPKLIDFPPENPHRLIFYVKSAWQSYKKYNASVWVLRFKETENGVEILRLS